MLDEVARELRWLWYSKSAHFLSLAAVLFAAWSVFSSLQYLNSMSRQFNETLENYRLQGRGIDEALRQDAGVVEQPNGARDIANPLRYDFDNLMTAESNFTLLGSINHVLGTASLLLLPILFFSTGLFWAIHDLESGGISVRNTPTSPNKIMVSKVVAISLISAASVVGCALLAALFAFLVSISGRTTIAFFSTSPVGEFGEFGSFLPAFLVAVVIAVVAAILGAAVGLTLRQRTLIIAGIVLLYFLTPLFGNLDPRNILASAILARVNVYGFFSPMTLGDISGMRATMVIIAVGILIGLLLVLRWRKMAKRVS